MCVSLGCIAILNKTHSFRKCVESALSMIHPDIHTMLWCSHRNFWTASLDDHTTNTLSIDEVEWNEKLTRATPSVDWAKYNENTKQTMAGIWLIYVWLSLVLCPINCFDSVRCVCVCVRIINLVETINSNWSNCKIRTMFSSSLLFLFRFHFKESNMWLSMRVCTLFASLSSFSFTFSFHTYSIAFSVQLKNINMKNLNHREIKSNFKFRTNVCWSIASARWRRRRRSSVEFVNIPFGLKYRSIEIRQIKKQKNENNNNNKNSITKESVRMDMIFCMCSICKRWRGRGRGRRREQIKEHIPIRSEFCACFNANYVLVSLLFASFFRCKPFFSSSGYFPF